MFLDADEFLIAPSLAHFQKAMAAIPPGSAARLPWRTFLPDPAAKPDDHRDVLTAMTWRRVREYPAYTKMALRLGGRADLGLVVGQGAHNGLSSTGEALLKHPVPKDIYIAHLPVRSRRQMLAKGVLGWKANLARNNSRRVDAIQWKRLHDLYFNETGSSDELDLSKEALIYAQSKPHRDWKDNARPESPPINGLRKYSDGTSETVELLIASAETPGDRHPSRFSIAKRNPVSSVAKPQIETAFDEVWHWRKLFLDIPPFANLFETLKPSSVLDVGCGHGLYLEIARQCGASEILGIDGMDRSGTALQEGEYLQLDLQEHQTLGRTFDLVLCLEVVEHIRPDATATLFDFLAAHAEGAILFSMAEPGQPGHGHINCLPMEEVLTLWQDRGWWPDLTATLGFRGLATLSWFRRNVVLLRQGRPPGADHAAAALKQIADRKYRWYGQAPGIRHAVCEEPYPGSKGAYSTKPGK